MKRIEQYSDWKYGTVNAIEASEIPKEACRLSQNIYYRENRWRKLPGLVEIHTAALSANPINGVFKYKNIDTGKNYNLAYCGTSLFAFPLDTRIFTAIYSPMSLNSQVSFLEFQPSIYFGSENDLWRRFDGGTVTYPVGGNNGIASDAPRKFSKIIYGPDAQRFFAIGQKENKNILFFSNNLDNGGIEVWPDGNQQVIETFKGDSPKGCEIYEGSITIFSDNSINTGNVVGVPQNWRFQREKSKTGTVAGNSVKRYGNNFFMLTPDYEIYSWPEDKLITQGRVKFDIDPNFANLAWAEIVANRYYYISFRSGQAVSSNKYHLWIYDILGDRWYGPHIGYNLASMFFDPQTNLLLCGGDDTNQGFMMEHRGLDLRNATSTLRWEAGYLDQGLLSFDKRYSKFRIKAKQTGDIAGAGNLQVIFNIDDRAGNPQSQYITLEDPAPANLANTSQVRDSIVKRGHIQEQYGRGRSCQIVLVHSVQAGDFEFSNFEIEYYTKTKKENRGV